MIARWEDSQYSFNLFRSSLSNTFALVMFSKRLDAQAEAAIAKSLKLEGQEASAERSRSREKRGRRPGNVATEEHKSVSPLTSVWRNNEFAVGIFKANLTEDGK